MAVPAEGAGAAIALEVSHKASVRKIKLREGTNTATLFGHHDLHLKMIEDDLGVRMSARGEELALE
ncbi:MAG: hypothetical protein ACREJW_11585, partial [Candidatus Methylomirabilales bacterium]